MKAKLLVDFWSLAKKQTGKELYKKVNMEVKKASK